MADPKEKTPPLGLGMAASYILNAHGFLLPIVTLLRNRRLNCEGLPRETSAFIEYNELLKSYDSMVFSAGAFARYK